jgi:tetratricopeptide (TPR) repeat protein/tRNA A-37 threonylcarbamoyl transferase component Bud32
VTIKCPECDTANPSDSKYCKQCAIPLPSPEDIKVTETMEAAQEELTTGSTFADRYQIIEVLGKGGMGRVYRVLDKKLKEEIALKLIKPEIASDKKTVERFSNELKIARKIGHKNVARMFDLNEEQGTHYITMEYVRGEDLKRLIRKMGPFSAGQAIPIAKQICEGLSEAHRLGVVHRDLKPQNVMVDEAGNARIMDFGIARSLESKGITGAGVMVGTPEYMSPEQVEGKEAGQSSDIYSLGVILYEMVTGRVPFEGDTPFTIGVKHKSEMPKNPKELNAQIPEDLSAVIMRCLEKAKENRYQSAGEVRSELENIQRGIPTTERVVPERKPFTSREITVQFSVRKLFIPALILIAVVIIGIILWQVLPRDKVVPFRPSDKPSLAVVYFMNQTGDEALDHWREALPRWIITDLSQSKYINVLPADRLFSVLRKLNLLEAKSYASEDLKNVVREGRINHIFQASLSKAGDIFRIDYSLQRADTLEIIASDYVTGKSEESFPSLVDDITKKIKANLELSEEQVTSDIDSEVSMITSSSPEAFKYYTIGRKFHLQGEYRKGIELMEQAVAIDPEFAMAYRTMAMAYGNLGRRAKAMELFQKALKLTDRLSARERYRIEADFYLRSEKTFDKAFEAYEKLLAIYPDERGARHNLAVLYRAIDEDQKAIEHYEILIKKYKTDSYLTYGNLSARYDALGLYDKAKEVCEEYLNNFPDSVRIHQRLAVHYRYQGEYDLALEEMDKAFALAPTYWLNFRRKGDIYFYMGDLKKAEEEYRKLLEKEEPSANAWGMQRLGWLFVLQGRFKDTIEMAKRGIEQAKELGEKTWIWGATRDMAYVELRLGNFERALELLERIWKGAYEDGDLIAQRMALNRKALVYVEMKRLAEAGKAAQELKELIEQGMNKNRMRRYYHLMGMIEIERKDYSKAIEYFKKGLPLSLPTSGIRLIYADSLGLAYYKSGDLEKAREEYERIASHTRGRIENSDVYAKSFYMLGKIYEQQDNKPKAIQNYEKFLDLWKNADPGLVEVEDARERLAGLESLP